MTRGGGGTPIYGLYGYVPLNRVCFWFSDSGTGYKNRPFSLEQGMYLLTEWEGRTVKYLARGQDVRTEGSEVRAS